jgi:hypothetical protein
MGILITDRDTIQATGTVVIMAEEDSMVITVEGAIMGAAGRTGQAYSLTPNTTGRERKYIQFV